HCGADQLATRERVAATYERTRALERGVAELREMAGARERELDLLAFELDEIEAVAPGEEEAAQLTAERDRLRHLETLRLAAAGGADAGAPAGGGGAAELLALAEPELEAAAAIDPQLAALSSRMQTLRYEA